MSIISEITILYYSSNRELSKLRGAPVLLSYEDRDYSPEKKKVKDQFFDLAER